VRDQVWAALTAARQAGWDGLVAEQRAFLDEFWDRADVQVDGDPEVQQAVRFGLFHVLQAGSRAAGGARTHDRRIMRTTAQRTIRSSCPDTTGSCPRWP
jgi:trehalose/maltose hydrolase-like predicted phosphorylase